MNNRIFSPTNSQSLNTSTITSTSSSSSSTTLTNQNFSQLSVTDSLSISIGSSRTGSSSSSSSLFHSLSIKSGRSNLFKRWVLRSSTGSKEKKRQRSVSCLKKFGDHQLNSSSDRNRAEEEEEEVLWGTSKEFLHADGEIFELVGVKKLNNNKPSRKVSSDVKRNDEEDGSMVNCTQPRSPRLQQHNHQTKKISPTKSHRASSSRSSRSSIQSRTNYSNKDKNDENNFCFFNEQRKKKSLEDKRTLKESRSERSKLILNRKNYREELLKNYPPLLNQQQQQNQKVKNQNGKESLNIDEENDDDGIIEFRNIENQIQMIDKNDDEEEKEKELRLMMLKRTQVKRNNRYCQILGRSNRNDNDDDDDEIGRKRIIDKNDKKDSKYDDDDDSFEKEIVLIFLSSSDPSSSPKKFKRTFETSLI